MLKNAFRYHQFLPRYFLRIHFKRGVIADIGITGKGVVSREIYEMTLDVLGEVDAFESSSR